MATFLITYDLCKPGRDYDELFEAIKAYGTYSHPVESVWLISTSLDVSSVCDDLQSHIDANDKLFVIKVAPGVWASQGLRDATVTWLNNRAA